MNRDQHEKAGRNRAKSDDRRAKLARQLRANLLKRKAQTKARDPPKGSR
jgi:hypothetical protein